VRRLAALAQYATSLLLAPSPAHRGHFRCQRAKTLQIVLPVLKKLCTVLIAILLGFIALGAIGLVSAAIHTSALSKEAGAYVNAAIPAIVTGWNEQELLNRASPEFKQSAPPAKLDNFFHWFSGLGRLKQCDPAEGHAHMHLSPQEGEVITALYTVHATFEKGEATIELRLVKRGDQWQIVNFVLNSPALPPHK
jgi:hypothetical protein